MKVDWIRQDHAPHSCLCLDQISTERRVNRWKWLGGLTNIKLRSKQRCQKNTCCCCCCCCMLEGLWPCTFFCFVLLQKPLHELRSQKKQTHNKELRCFHNHSPPITKNRNLMGVVTPSEILISRKGMTGVIFVIGVMVSLFTVFNNYF